MMTICESYLCLAKELVGMNSHPSCSEAKVRTAISRAYFAAYLTAYNFLVSNHQADSMPNGSEKHKYVIDKYRYSKNPCHQTIGTILEELRFKRNIADYGKPMSNYAKEALHCVLSADALLGKLKTSQAKRFF